MKYLAIALICFSAAVADEFIPVDENALARFKTLGHLVASKGDQVPQLEANIRNAIDDRLVALLEGARDRFGEGFPDANIPPLDPFKLSSVQFSVQDGNVFRANVQLTDLDVRGLKGFIIENLQLRIIGLNLVFDFTIPQIDYNSRYKVDGRILTIFRWRPSGNANVVAKGIKVVGNAALGTSNGHLVLRGFNIEFDVDSTKLNIEGLIGDGLVNSIVNWILNIVSDDFIQGQRIRLSEYVSEVLFDVISEVIGDYTISDLLG